MVKEIKDTVETRMENMDDLSEKEYIKLKTTLETLRGKRNGKLYWIISSISTIILSMLFLLCYYDWYYKITIQGIVGSILIALIVTSIPVAFLAMMIESQETSLKRRILEYEAQNIKNEMKEDIFENSIEMSYKYLDQYYLQTREQAQRGFYVTIGVAIFGAILIGVGIVTMFIGKIEPTVITCATGVLTEFISAIFFYLYNKTITSMSKYHNKLVYSQNISIALKVSDSLPAKDKIEAKNMIIKELLKDINAYLVKSDSTEKTT